MSQAADSRRSRNIWVGMILGLFLSQAVLWSFAIAAVVGDPAATVDQRQSK